MKKYLLVLVLGMFMLGCEKNVVTNETLQEVTTSIETTELESTTLVDISEKMTDFYEIETSSEESTVPSEMESIREESTTPSEKETADFESEAISEETTTAEPEPIVLPAARVGDTVYFGTYEQDNNLENGQEPICWYVLDEKDGKFFLFSKYILDVSIFDDKSSVWETSMIREWLNNDFYNTAFSNDDKAAISTTVLKNSDVAPYGDAGGADTEDKVFLLSIRDLKNYLGAKIVRKEPREWWIYKYEWAAVTPYCAARGMRVNKEGCGPWFIRRLSGEDYSGDWVVAYHYMVDDGLKVGEFDCEYGSYEDGIRPGMWVDKDAVCTVVPMTKEETEPIVVADDFIIEWKNEIVEREARRITGIADGPLTYGDVKNITKLDFQRVLVNNIDDLVYFTSLEELDLRSHPLGNSNENTLSDIRVLARLRNLTSLKISGNVALDINPLAYVKSLKHLELKYNNVTSVHPLVYLTNLESLVIYDDIANADVINNLKSLKGLDIYLNGGNNLFKISDTLCGLEELYIVGLEEFVGLEKLVNLKSLTCKGIDLKCLQGLGSLEKLQRLELRIPEGVDELEDIIGLSDLANLAELSLIGSNIKSISGIEKLTNLEILDLPGGNYELSGLETLTNLTSLDISVTKSDSMKYLKNMQKLTSLNISCTNIKDLESLSNLTNLTSLNISGKDINDLSCLSNLTNLTSLCISDATVFDISEIGKLTNLVSLDIRDIPIKDISVIGKLTNLEILKMDDIDTKDIIALTNLSNLKELSISKSINNSSYMDMSVLSQLKSLNYLSISNIKISDVSPIGELTNLTVLRLYSNAISNIDALSGLINLEELTLSDNNIKSVKSLSNLKNLTWLSIPDNPVKDYSPVQFVKILITDFN